ncbi:MAG: OmpA family protein [Candidatus Hydrogenedentes bacterium]|nr:OmpA family protein [Candidatus Hydrogenedentota bacterium]
MEMHRKHEEGHENDERWLLTYADLITLLMVFFVVMYSMSQTDAKKFKALAGALQAVFGAGGGSSSSVVPTSAQGAGSQSRGTPQDTRSTRKQRMERLRNSLEALVAQEGLGNAVHFQTGPDFSKLVMELSDSLMFPVGSADLTEDAKRLLAPMGDVLSKSDHLVHVEGHTDNMPISSQRFANNWELSAARAAQVIQFLIDVDKLPPERFSASGYAEFRPVADNSTEEGRARNRRVEFVIYDEGVSDPMGAVATEPSPNDTSAVPPPEGLSTDSQGVPSASDSPIDAVGNSAPETTPLETDSVTPAPE